MMVALTRGAVVNMEIFWKQIHWKGQLAVEERENKRTTHKSYTFYTSSWKDTCQFREGEDLKTKGLGEN